MLLRSLGAYGHLRLLVKALRGSMAWIFLSDSLFLGPNLFVNDEKPLKNETLWWPLGDSWSLWGIPGPTCSDLRSVLEPFGRVLGTSWGDLGASWSGLGASCNPQVQLITPPVNKVLVY